MGRVSTGGLLFRFALVSLAVLVALGAATTFLGQRIIADRIQGSSAGTAVDTILPRLEAGLADVDVRTTLDGTATQRLHQATAGFLSDHTVVIRIWNRDGVAIFSTRDGEAGGAFLGDDELQRAFAGETALVVSDGAEVEGDAGRPEEVLQIFNTVGGAEGEPAAVVEIVQDYAGTAAQIETATTALYSILGLGGVLAWIALQALAWWSTRRVRDQNARLARLLQIGQGLRSSLDVAEIVARTAREAADLAKSQYGFVCLLEGDGRELILKATFDLVKNHPGHHNRRVDDGYLVRVAVACEAVSAKLRERPLSTVLGVRGAQGPAALVSVPMRVRGEAIGVVSAVRHPSLSGFSDGEVALLQELADQAAMAIDQAGLFARVRQHANDLETSYDTTLRALMAALDTKDATTEGHSERVARLTVAVAREMGVPEERLLDIERGALLHDVGKIGVPDSVLRKPGSLDKDEWEAMQKHPLLAALMVSKVDFLEGTLPILLYHHERYDGSGYPFGLAGDKIPLEARIFAIVDSYDAMTSERPYSQAMSPQDALREIRAQAGAQFDPEVVQAFEAVIARLLMVEETPEAA